MDSKWKDVWNRRHANKAALSGSWQDIFLELKRMNGFDVMDGGIPLDSLLMQARRIKELLHLAAGMSVFDVGCGAGANLYLMQHEGLIVGGSDYAEGLVETARRVVPDAREMGAMEAADIPTEEKYDAVYSCGVFSYFPDHDYATRVLERMLAKSRHAIGITELHDRAKRQDYLAFRRANIPNYDERYEGLGRLFFRREFFEEFAARHDLRLVFPNLEMANYWNTPFIFTCFMYRK